jgi:uncharacterized protein involved in exopolysaccharide biosynthesis
MDFEEILALIRQRWLSMVVIVVCTVFAVGVWTETREREYTSSAAGLVMASDSQSIADSYSGSILAQSMAKSYLMLFTSRTVAQ